MLNELTLKWKKLHPEAIIPKYQTNQSAGFDFHAVVLKDYIGSCTVFSSNANVVIDGKVPKGDGSVLIIAPGNMAIVKTGLACVIPVGYEMQIRPRSGLAFKKQITLQNSPGTIDSDYRNEIGIMVRNEGKENFIIEHGDRIAQGIIAPIVQPEMLEIEEFSKDDLDSDRGGGFGSTGTN